MQRPIRPRWLLRLARELAGSGRGQPRNTNLRRATSTAYYALFHHLALATAAHALPGSSSEEIRRAARHVSHVSINQVAAWVAGDTPPKHLESIISRLRGNSDVTSVATAFVTIHELREQADYDHEAEFTRPGTHASIEQAARTVALLDRHGGDDDVRAFLGLVVLRTSIRSR